MAYTRQNFQDGDVLYASNLIAMEDQIIENENNIPTKTSDLTNDSGFITQETDPTVPSWAKQTNKPEYSSDEIAHGDSTVADEIDSLKEKVSKTFDSIVKKKDYLYEVTTGAIDYDYAYEYFESMNPQIQPYGCSAVHLNSMYGRNFDWQYNEQASFVVHVPAQAGRYSSIGIAGSVPNVLNDNQEEWNQAIIPFFTQDGINEYGLTISTLVVPSEGNENRSVPVENIRDSVNGVMLCRYVLDRYKTVSEAIEDLTNYVEIWFSDSLHDMGYEQHWLIADENDTYAIEIVDNELVATDAYWLTNFIINGVALNDDYTVYTPATLSEGSPTEDNGITAHGSGLERWNIIASNDGTIEDIMSELTYTKAYMGAEWYTEFVGGSLHCDSPVADFASIVSAAETAYENRTREDEVPTWQTVHSAIYDMENRTLSLTVQEDGESLEFELGSLYSRVETLENLKADRDEVPTNEEKEAWNNKAPVHINHDGNLTDEQFFALPSNVYIFDEQFEIFTSESDSVICESGTIINFEKLQEEPLFVRVLMANGDCAMRSAEDSYWEYFDSLSYQYASNGYYDSSEEYGEGTIGDAISQQYAAIAAKYTKPANGIPKADLAADTVEVFIAEYGTTPYSDILAAVQAGKHVQVSRTVSGVVRMYDYTATETNKLLFGQTYGANAYYCSVTNANVWTQGTFAAGSATDLDALEDVVNQHSSDIAALNTKKTYVAVIGTTSYASVKSAYDNGCAVFAVNATSGRYYQLILAASSKMMFASMNEVRNYSYYNLYSDDRWTGSGYDAQAVSNLTTTITASSTDTQYPSAKAVYDWLRGASGNIADSDKPSICQTIGAATADSLSDAYSATKAYDVGDICIYNATLWRCISACTGVTPVVGSNWVRTSVSDELEPTQEWITTVTVGENTSEITINKDHNGQPFILTKRITVAIDFAKHGTGNIMSYLKFFNHDDTLSRTMIQLRQNVNSATYDYFICTDFVYIGGYRGWDIRSTANDFNNNGNLYTGSYLYAPGHYKDGVSKTDLMPVDHIKEVSKILWKVDSDTNVIPAGSRILIWGHRDA